MDAEVLRLRAHIDQTRSTMRDMVRTFLEEEALDQIIKTCAQGRLDEFDERLRLFIGMLAIVAIFNLLETAPGAQESEEA
jgi:hypothetical protein